MPFLSIIIPTVNEAACLDATLSRIDEGRSGEVEVIVADAGSSDGTVAIAAHHRATVVRAPAGRGPQLNAGAAGAHGAALLFLHADTLLPEGYESHVRRILAEPDVVAGAFELCIDAPMRSLRLVERWVSRRSRHRQLPYGDQGLFLSADTFREVGGFPPIPVMEDYELVRRLRRIGRIEIAPARVVTSARRWRGGGVWRTSLRNQACMVAYRIGVAPERIARWRSARGQHEVPARKPTGPEPV